MKIGDVLEIEGLSYVVTWVSDDGKSFLLEPQIQSN
jgi:hypothetical protein